MSDVIEDTEAAPEQRNKSLCPREFLLEGGARISWVTTESFESIKGRKVTRFDDSGSMLRRKIVEEVTARDVVLELNKGATEAGASFRSSGVGKAEVKADTVVGVYAKEAEGLLEEGKRQRDVEE
ncbi:hypothetical protein Slin15195_G114000 [Septoria linicola]|uniref:Uncharacterized protein n=1 Tax=Septoria linicola TaxID=215465 RepID=A0A9Q9ENR9_9PEZI|nr:hypothetical protein Slin15195_G114000 [Septoria linicola]